MVNYIKIYKLYIEQNIIYCMNNINQNSQNPLENLYYIQAVLDLNAMKILYDKNNYGNSAYHCQQFSEKMIKCIMHKYGLETKKLHNISNILIEIIEKEVRKITSEIPIIDYIETSKRIIKKIEEKNTNLNWWKKSLGIEKTKNDKYFYKILKTETTSKTIKHIEYIKQYVKQSKQIYIERNRQSIQKHIDEFEVDFNYIKKCLDVSDFSFNILDELFCYNKRLSILLGRTLLCNPDKDNKRIVDLLVLLGWIVSFSIPLLKIYPHEVYGRYTERIDGESTLKWYNKHHLELHELEKEIEHICRRLDETLFSRYLDKTSSYLLEISLNSDRYSDTVSTYNKIC